jgi:hypothetical protein
VRPFGQSKTERIGDRMYEILRLAAPGYQGRERKIGPLLDNQPRFERGPYALIEGPS